MRIGGDIGGLRAVAASLTGVVGEVSDTGEYLSKRVDQLVGDAGWSGAAAEEFKGAWEQDAAALVEIASCTRIAGRCLAELADALDTAQRQLDHAVAAAKAAGMPFTADDQPINGPYVGPAADAATQFSVAAQAAFEAAKQARETAIEELHDIAAAIHGDGTSFLKAADAAALAAALKGYYALPNELSEIAQGELDEFNRRYKATQYERKHSTAGSKAKAELTEQLKQMRAERKLLQTDAEVAEKFADRFKAGRLLGSSVGDIADSMGVLSDGSKLSRVLDGLPAVDIVVGAFATWAQAKEDHEKGWSWTHAIIADGGSNAAAIGAGLATDCIPGAGPFLAPAVSYGVGAWTYEAAHEGHWTEHIHEDGVAVGTAEGLWDTTKATWENDGYGMFKKVESDVQHPVDAAKSLWHGVKNLF
ncbi:WXG100 family type VII secretion target [Planosporangium thailandense]|uniref:WXG100 family type VII secretion target n=1 Tax=Planosporangium thailandense TaxID=765197 RepID=A0ABX0XWJ6_9ACTN|nr:WXG100 family type VII secretion target [Planosporangium thailandense]NJC69605.1 WXG100 family type VII secretion target [Planosporangium thailandense]